MSHFLKKMELFLKKKIVKASKCFLLLVCFLFFTSQWSDLHLTISKKNRSFILHLLVDMLVGFIQRKSVPKCPPTLSFKKKLTLHFQISGVSLQLGPRTGEPLHPFAGAPKAPLRKTFECRAQNVTRWNANCHSFGVSLCFKKCHFGWGESPSGPL